MVIWSQALDPANRQLSGSSKYRCAELALVAEGSTTTLIQLVSPLRFVEGVADATAPTYANPYTTAFGSRVGVVHAEDHCRVKLPNGAYLAGQEASWTSGAFRIVGYVNPEIQGGSITRGYGFGLATTGTYNAVIEDFHVQNLEDNTGNGQYGYGIDGNGTNTHVNRLVEHNTRHAFTTNCGATLDSITDINSMLASVRCVDFVVTEGRSVGSSNGPWDAHSDATDGKFVDCVTIDSLADGAGGRGQNITYVRPIIRGAVRGVSAGTEPNTSFAFVNGDRQKDFTSIKVIDPDIECDGEVLVNENSTLEVSGMGRYKTTAGQLFANARRGVITISGDHRAVLTGDAGEADLGFIKGELLSAWATGDAAGIYQEGTLVLVGSGVTSTTPIAVELDADNTFSQRGLVRMTLPNPTVLLTTTGTVSSEGNGLILFDIDGAADNSGTTNLASHPSAQVKSVDGTVVQYDITFSDATGASLAMSGDVSLADASKILLGTGDDAEVFHNGSDFISDNFTGDIFIRNRVADGIIKIQSDNAASNGVVDYFRAVGATGEAQLSHYGNVKFSTKSTGADVTGDLAVSGDISLPDGSELRLGTDDDFQVYHNGSNAFLDNATGEMFIRQQAVDGRMLFQADNGSGGTENYIVIDGATGDVELRHGNAVKLNTKSTGVDVTGSIDVSGDVSLLKTGGLHAGGSTVTDATATSFTPRSSYGTLRFTTTEGGFDVYYNTATPACAFMGTVPAWAGVTTGVLTGVLGGSLLTVSAATDGKIYIENNRGSARAVQALALGGGA